MNAQREEARRQRNETVPFDWQLVKLDQTVYCDAQYLAKHKIERCGVFYLFDANRHVHICSFTASAELWPMNAYALPIGGADLTDAEHEAFGDVEIELMASEEACSYIDMADALRLPRQPVSQLPEREEGEDSETYYMRAVEHVREYLAGNPAWF